MKNEHMIPPAVKDLREKILAHDTSEVERSNLYVRVKAIRDFCDETMTCAYPVIITKSKTRKARV